MGARDYGQYCGVARALDVVGERWALLVVRDLLVGPRRFGELQRGLPRIPSNVLSTRLRELEASGVVVRQLLPAPGRGTTYALTESGRRLEPVVLAMGRWGAQRLGELRPGEVVTADSLVMALRTTFRPEAADADATYELRLGDAVVHATVAGGSAEVRPGPAERPDLVIEAGSQLRAVLAGETSPSAAVRSGQVVLTGRKRLFAQFAAAFRI